MVLFKFLREKGLLMKLNGFLQYRAIEKGLLGIKYTSCNIINSIHCSHILSWQL